MAGGAGASLNIDGTGAGNVRLRRAGPDDADKVYAWRNDPWILSLSKSGRGVAAAEHLLWYEGMLLNPDQLMFIVEVKVASTSEYIEIGVVRVERSTPDAGLITIYLLRPYTGRGYGVRALLQATAAAFGRWHDLNTIHAVIRSDNTASVRAFRKAGFTAIARIGPRGEDGNFCEMRLMRA